jgi:ABC-type cobalamin/Fe3+-siderophores transport system ATPase subunit
VTEEIIDRIGIRGVANDRVDAMPTGQARLVELGRALATKPRVLLLDEPAAHLDIGHQLQLFRVLDEVRGRGVAVLAVVHDLQRAAAWAGRMVLLDGGRVTADGMPAAVLGSAECARAFQVAIRGHAAAGLPHAVYSFEEIR